MKKYQKSIIKQKKHKEIKRGYRKNYHRNLSEDTKEKLGEYRKKLLETYYAKKNDVNIEPIPVSSKNAFENKDFT